MILHASKRAFAWPDQPDRAVFCVGPYGFVGPNVAPSVWRPKLALIKGRTNYLRGSLMGFDGFAAYPRQPYQRVSGPPTPTGGRPFDLRQFNEPFWSGFDRLLTACDRARIVYHVELFDHVFVKAKDSCGFNRHPFGNGVNVNRAALGDVDANHDGAGDTRTEFYDLAALKEKTGSECRLNKAIFQRDFVNKLIETCSSHPCVLWQIANECPDVPWLNWWARYIATRSPHAITINAPAVNSRLAPVVVGATWHKVLPAFAGYYPGRVRGVDSDGDSGFDYRRSRELALQCRAAGIGIFGVYAEGWPDATIRDVANQLSGLQEG
jgi:hypothetical protein